ncbi:MAG: hypothetical protein CEO22_601 [Candidatus Berkelbacteria bacterium Gr01-1014_85]|uniref:Type II secretion system protein GspG C-terminal domain-containing protein n=1 Tax=Candidatus Berkelbacteria bacterium Gr01-1014_85 TaxID=2017150 RepID=A0A554J9X0_9BACT|nr:MAG: hypothetical protein CEO22_601 [Candidatus Berkelbacteria bacterium Gr01-1014_85]
MGDKPIIFGRTEWLLISLGLLLIIGAASFAWFADLFNPERYQVAPTVAVEVTASANPDASPALEATVSPAPTLDIGAVNGTQPGQTTQSPASSPTVSPTTSPTTSPAVASPAATASASVEEMDNRRIADINNIKAALIGYYRQTKEYPPSGSFSEGNTALAGSPLNKLVPSFLAALPTDPLNPTQYYGYRSDGQTFTLTARLQSTANPLGEYDGDLYLYQVTDRL